MLAVALISIRGGNRHTCVRGSVKHKIIRAYIEERSPMRSAHHHRSCFTGDTGQNPKMTPFLRISHFTHFSRKNEVEAFRSVEYKQTNAVGWIWATFRVQTCFFYFRGNLGDLGPLCLGQWYTTHPWASWAKTCFLGCKHFIYHTDIPCSRNTAIFTLLQIYAFGNWKTQRRVRPISHIPDRSLTARQINLGK